MIWRGGWFGRGRGVGAILDEETVRIGYPGWGNWWVGRGRDGPTRSDLNLINESFGYLVRGRGEEGGEGMEEKRKRKKGVRLLKRTFMITYMIPLDAAFTISFFSQREGREGSGITTRFPPQIPHTISVSFG